MKQILTLEQLVQFCEEHQLLSFDAKKAGFRLAVQVPVQGIFEQETREDHPGLLFVKVRVCHTLKNRNGTYISEDNMKKAMPTLKYRPLLGYIHQLDNGEWDFHAHDMEFVDDGDGGEQVEYMEQQIGAFTADEPELVYDKDKDKTYVEAYAVIPENYTRAAEIIRDKVGTKVSCELNIETFQYNAKEKYLELIDFYFSGCTCLGREKDGTEIGEGMLGARLDITDFSEAKNSVMNFADRNFGRQLIDALERLNAAISGFNRNQGMAGAGGKEEDGRVKFNELLEKYGKTADDVAFAYEGMTDEELEAAFEKAFGGTGTQDQAAEPEGHEPETEPEEPECHDPEEPAEPPQVYRKVFELSHEDIRYALYQLLVPYEEADNESYFIDAVYDGYFVYENWAGNVVYGQRYAKDGDNVAFVDERYNLHREFLTDSEYAELQSMRANYAAVVSELNTYKAAAEKAEKESLLAADAYAVIHETEDYKKIAEGYQSMTLADVQAQLDAALLAYAKTAGTFAAQNGGTGNPQGPQKHVFGAAKPVKKDRYGGIFAVSE